jgi:hypothetical protein
MRAELRHLRRGWLFAVLAGACAGPRPLPAPASASLLRPAGERAYRFTSTQLSPAGRSQVEVDFILRTSSTGEETAVVTGYRHASGGAVLAPGVVDPACLTRVAPPPGAIAVLPITPPPTRLARLIPDCVPEDLFGAASDILPLLMIQVQPRYRAGELRRIGDRLRFAGYQTGWRLPPGLLDASITADSGVVSLDSVAGARLVIGWNTSPMRIALVRQVGPAQRALLHGEEWFWAQIVIDRKSGLLLSGRTIVDSLALRMVLPYSDSTVPAEPHREKDAGIPVAVSRTLELVLLGER